MQYRRHISPKPPLHACKTTPHAHTQYVVSRILLVWKGEVRLQQSEEGHVEVDVLTTCKNFNKFLKSAPLSHMFIFKVHFLTHVHLHLQVCSPPLASPSDGFPVSSHFIHAKPSGCTWPCPNIHPAAEVAATAPPTLPPSFLSQQ